MNKTIANMFKHTKNAVLVDRYFGKLTDDSNPVVKLLNSGEKKKVYALAKNLSEAAKEAVAA